MVELAPVVARLTIFDRWPAVRRLAEAAHRAAPGLALLGLGISLLHQSSLGATYGILKSWPIWFKPTTPLMFVLSAIAAGPALTMGLALAIEWITGRRTVPHDILRLIARFSGFGLLAYAYLRLWDLAVVTYYGRTPAVDEAMALLDGVTPYGFGFWVGEVTIGIALPLAFFLLPAYNRRPYYLAVGAALAVIGVIVNRWNVTVSGLIVPLGCSPGVLYTAEPGSYWPSLAEWGVAIGIIGYALGLPTLGVRYLPIFSEAGGEEASSRAAGGHAQFLGGVEVRVAGVRCSTLEIHGYDEQSWFYFEAVAERRSDQQADAHIQ